MDDEEAAERSARALEAALLLMNVVTVPKMPAELLSEDACEHVLSIAKRSLANMHKSLMEGGSFDAATTITPKKAPPPPAAAGKKGGRGARGASKAPAPPPAPAAIDGPSTGSTLTLLLERMPHLAGCYLTDSLTHLLQLGLSAAFGTAGSTASTSNFRDTLPLQMAGMRVIVGVFTEHEELRRAIISDVIDARLQATLPENRQMRRNYALPDGARVQLFVAPPAARSDVGAHPRRPRGGQAGGGRGEGEGRTATPRPTRRAQTPMRRPPRPRAREGSARAPGRGEEEEGQEPEKEAKKKDAKAKAAAAKAVAEHPWKEVQTLVLAGLRTFSASASSAPTTPSTRRPSRILCRTSSCSPAAPSGRARTSPRRSSAPSSACG